MHYVIGLAALCGCARCGVVLLCLVGVLRTVVVRVRGTCYHYKSAR
jgi:hypothetical protein